MLIGICNNWETVSVWKLKLTFLFCLLQDGARIADSVARVYVASTLDRGSWINMGNFKGTTYLLKVITVINVT